MNKCPNCEYHKESARMWRQEAYKLSGHPLNDEPEPVAWVKKLNTMIIGCDDVIDEDGVHEDAKKLAKLVKKDCYEILQNLKEEKNGGAI